MEILLVRHFSFEVSILFVNSEHLLLQLLVFLHVARHQGRLLRLHLAVHQGHLLHVVLVLYQLLLESLLQAVSFPSGRGQLLLEVVLNFEEVCLGLMESAHLVRFEFLDLVLLLLQGIC